MNSTGNRVHWCWIAVLVCAPAALAQQDAPQSAQTTKPLPAKQQMIQDRIRRLEDRMFRLYEKLAETEPENAAKLSAALERIGQADIDDRVERLVGMLADDARLLRAHDEQQQLLADLEGIRALLMQRRDADAHQGRMEQLGQYRREVEQLLEEQRRLRHGAADSAGDPEDAADRQRDTADKTGDLAARMRGGQQQPDGGPAGQPAPGQQNVEQARRHMDDAAEDLDRRDHGSATEDQDRAVDELNEARRRLEDELQQLRREERQELLRDLEGRFAEMLSRQLAINADTAAIRARGAPHLTRPDLLRVAELVGRQQELAAEAGTCLHILREEGTTIAFPRIVEQIRLDMNLAAERMSGLQIGPLTQAIQEQIVEALRDLIEAVQRLQEQDERHVGQEGQQGDEPPLLPQSAELKLLRAAQLRINRRTAATEQARQDGTEPADRIAQVARQLADRQREVAEIAGAMRERQ